MSASGATASSTTGAVVCPHCGLKSSGPTRFCFVCGGSIPVPRAKAVPARRASPAGSASDGSSSCSESSSECPGQSTPTASSCAGGRQEFLRAEVEGLVKRVLDFCPPASATPAQITSELEAMASEFKDAVLRYHGQLIDSSVAASASRQRSEYRARVVGELVATEGVYLQSLRLLQGVWQSELVRSGLMSQDDLNVVFGGCGQLLSLTEAIGEALTVESKKPDEAQMIGAAVQAKIPYIRLYKQYTATLDQAQEILNGATKASPRLREFLDKVRLGNPDLRRQDLLSFLAKPAQRIVKYPLFLRDLIRYTEGTHPDYCHLVSAVSEMEGVLREINKNAKERQTFKLVSELNVLWRTDTAVDLLLSRSRIVRDGKVKSTLTMALTSPDETTGIVGATEVEHGNHVFLFDNLLLVTRQSSKRHHEVCTVMVKDLVMVQTMQKETEELSTLVLRSKQWLPGDELCLHFEGPENLFERQMWLVSFAEVISDGQPPAPIKTFSVTERRQVRRKSKRVGGSSAMVPATASSPPPPSSSGSPGTHEKKVSKHGIGELISNITKRSSRRMTEAAVAASSPSAQDDSEASKDEAIRRTKSSTDMRSFCVQPTTACRDLASGERRPEKKGVYCDGGLSIPPHILDPAQPRGEASPKTARGCLESQKVKPLPVTPPTKK